jgi:hypothetical protein
LRATEYWVRMKQFLATAVIGTIFALATAGMVLLYWLMMIVFGLLYVLTLPLHFFWRTVRGTA